MLNNEDLAQAERRLKDRELSPEIIDLAEKDFLSLIEKHPNEAKLFGLLSKLYYKKMFVTNTPILELHEKGIEYGLKGVALDPENIDSNFWLGVNYGLSAMARGVMSSYFLLEPTDKYLSKALSLDPSYFFGGPERAYGWFLHQIPAWPISKGDNKKALEHLLRSLKYCHDFFLTRYYLAKVYHALGERKRAKEQALWVIETPSNERYMKEEKTFKDEMLILIKSL
ncbi:MAG: hypothetical protein SFU98_18455 [Leptospiraceae bacterium]|nr:hypothetical protein [Leptospiraceae bacterium]